MDITLSWTRLKWRIDNHNLIYQSEEISDSETAVWAQDGFVVFNAILTGVDKTEFDDDYSAVSNKSVDKRESVTGLIKSKPRPVEGRLLKEYVYFTTGDSQSLDGSDSYSINTQTSGKTKIIFNPAFSYFIDGGSIKIISGTPSTPIKAKLTLAVGTDYEWTWVKNVKLSAANDLDCTECYPAYVKRYEGFDFHTITLEVEHAASDQIEIELCFRVFV